MPSPFRLRYLNNFKLEKDEIIRPRSDPFAMDGGVAILYGNLALDGAMIKTFSVPKEMHIHTGRPASSSTRMTRSMRCFDANLRRAM